MSSIAEILDWKFNSQPGMRCKELNGTLQIVEFPGGIPSREQQDQWIAEYRAYVDAGLKTDQECQNTLAQDKLARLLFEINFDQENRVRVLEGRAALTRQQYRAGLVAIWRTL